MRIFVIHSGCDYNKINELIKNIENTIYKIKILILKKGLPLIWKVNAYNKIKKANLILAIIGKNSYKSKYIAWEIKKAIISNKKIVVYKLNDDNILPELLYIKNEFNDKILNDKVVYSTEKFDDLITYINKIYD